MIAGLSWVFQPWKENRFREEARQYRDRGRPCPQRIGITRQSKRFRSLKNSSRFALNAGEGARAPSIHGLNDQPTTVAFSGFRK